MSDIGFFENVFKGFKWGFEENKESVEGGFTVVLNGGERRVVVVVMVEETAAMVVVIAIYQRVWTLEEINGGNGFIGLMFFRFC